MVEAHGVARIGEKEPALGEKSEDRQQRDRGRRGPVARTGGEPDQRDAEAERQRRAAHGLRVLPRNAKDEFVGQKCPLGVAGVEEPCLRNADTRRPNALLPSRCKSSSKEFAIA